MMEIHPERPPVKHSPRLTLIGLFVWLGIVAAAGMLVVGLSGCSTTTTFQGLCALQPIGMTDGGIAVARVQCEAT